MTLPKISITWTQRTPALLPVGVTAIGECAKALGRRLLRDDYAAVINRLEAVATDQILALFGDKQDLPWLDGVIYLGKDPQAGSLLTPTNLAPSIPIDVFQRAMISSFNNVAPPLVLLPVHRLFFSASPARAISKSRLSRWLEGNA